MRKAVILLSFLLLSSGTSVVAQQLVNNIPTEIRNSLVLARPGIDEIGLTVEGYVKRLPEPNKEKEECSWSSTAPLFQLVRETSYYLICKAEKLSMEFEFVPIGSSTVLLKTKLNGKKVDSLWLSALILDDSPEEKK